VDNLLRAAGAFQYIHENFTNAPSMDLAPDTLEMLVHLMCAQARECLFEKSELTLREADEQADADESEEADKMRRRRRRKRVEECLILAQEAAHVRETFN